MKNISAAAFTCLFILLSGCITPRLYVQAYDGEPVEQTKMALLKPTSAVKIVSINGKYIGVSGITSFGSAEYEIGILPGKHTVSVSYDNGAVYSESSVKLTFNAVAGHKYIIKDDIKPFDSDWLPSIVDVTDQPKCWTVKVGVLFGPNC